MEKFAGAAAREALVEEIVDELAPRGIRGARFRLFGGTRIGVLETAHAIAQAHPQLAGEIYAQFGMEGWGRDG